MPIPIQTEEEAFWYLHLTAAQLEAYELFRAHLEAEGHLLKGHDDKYTLLRFLKARQWDVMKATTMYLHMVEWRKSVNADKVFETLEMPEMHSLMKVYPHFYHKLDKYGRPVYYELLGQTDCYKMLEVSTEQRIMDYHIWTWERFERKLLPACSELAGRQVVTAIVVVDLQGLSLSMFGSTTRHLLHAVSKIDQDYYPEHLGQMYIINTPFIFKTIWAFVYPLLEERTRKKIHVLGYDYQKDLKQMVPEENLPERYGGKSKLDPDYVMSEGPWMGAEAMKGFGWCPPGTLSPTAGAPLNKAASERPKHDAKEDLGKGPGETRKVMSDGDTPVVAAAVAAAVAADATA